MLASENPHPKPIEFKQLMLKTNDYLNQDAKQRGDYYSTRAGNPLEDDVEYALNICAKGTPFEGSIIKVSGQKFPDIVANKFYGVEVKSTKGNHWTSTGSSILETTRIPDVERIYMTFGKLGGNPVEFLSKPYEECLYDIAVTHMPRYLINMKLETGQTIFDKMHIAYDDLRNRENPIIPVADYYRSQLKPGESLWWTGEPSEEKVAPIKIALWKTIEVGRQEYLKAKAMVLFPEIFGKKSDKYTKLVFWLISECGIVSPSTRDMFTAGGQIRVLVNGHEYSEVPGIIARVAKNIKYIKEILSEIDIKTLREYWGTYDSNKGVLENWAELVARHAKNDIVDRLLLDMLKHPNGVEYCNNALLFPSGPLKISESFNYQKFGR